MLAEWSAVWRVDQPVQTTMPRPRLVAEAAARLPLQEEDIARAATTFKKRTGLEVDDYHPRALLRVSHQGRQAFADLLSGISKHRVWPGRRSTLLACLALKERGVRSVLILLASTIRLWEAARQPVLWLRTGLGARTHLSIGTPRASSVVATINDQPPTLGQTATHHQSVVTTAVSSDSVRICEQT